MTVKGNNRQIEGLSALQVLVVDAAGPLLQCKDGRSTRPGSQAISGDLGGSSPILCNAALLGRRLGSEIANGLDVLELAAFVRPAAHLVPTIGGLASLLGLEKAAPDAESQAKSLRQSAALLLQEVAKDDFWQQGDASAIAFDMELAGWGWAPFLPAMRPIQATETNRWPNLPNWEDRSSPGPPDDNVKIDQEAVLARLDAALGPDAEPRPDQRTYAAAVAQIFGERQHQSAPNFAILEAGTGIGKTLGYLAPASLWAEKSKGTVWISTFTKNLQRQMDQELTSIYGGHEEKLSKTTIRKGRENYLCLLNLEETLQSARTGGDRRRRIFLGLILRWLHFSRDGDMIGGDFPRWLAILFPRSSAGGLSDRRGECIYAACGHYRQCFIERARRRSRDSRIVIANHAVTLIEATLRRNDPILPRHFIFDEGHQLFAAADSAFSLHLTGREGQELRRWLLGGEARRRGRAKGLRARLADLVATDGKAQQLLKAICEFATAMPSEGWLRRLQTVQPSGPFETFLMHARAHILARRAPDRHKHGLEVELCEIPDDMKALAQRLAVSLDQLATPMAGLASHLRGQLELKDAEFSAGDRMRLESAAAALMQRVDILIEGWILILHSLSDRLPVPQSHFDWLALDRNDGREIDIGLHRHWIDPTEPLAEAVMAPASGVCVTSATLRDRVRIVEGESDWAAAEERVGANHLPMSAQRKNFPSPFDYQLQSRVYVITDVNRDDPDQVAAAYRQLFMAAGGGALGLFTAIARLRGVHQRLERELGDAGIPLYGQHVDPLDPGTLVDIFRHEPQTCLLGTDALRDGVDVPGEALKLVVFDRVPWPRPTLLHRARRGKFGGRSYDEMLVRLRLKQAFGRLIRRATDRGVFVLLDAATPSRLLDGLPAGTVFQRLTLDDAVAETRQFLTTK